MKKEIVDKLIKVANNLDSLGYMREANIVDRVAKKIVVSQYKFLSESEARYIKITNNYITDINNYKNLINSAYRDDKPKKLYLDIAKDLLNAVETRSKYDERTKKVFKLQADRILYDASNNYTDINIALSNDKTKPLNYYLMKHKITDFRGFLLDDIFDKRELDKRFKAMKADPDISGTLDEKYFIKQLGDTYNILKSRFN